MRQGMRNDTWKTIVLGSQRCAICESVLYRHRAILLILRVRIGLVLGGFDHVEDDDQDRADEENEQEVSLLEKEEQVKAKRNNERSDT